MDASGRPHHPATPGRHLFSVGSDAGEPRGFDWDDGVQRFERPSFSEELFGHLIALVGDPDALQQLDGSPHPDEPFDWSVVEARDHAFVAEVLTLSDQCCDRMLDTEYRTITRRILARVAARDPRPLRRSTRADRCGAGMVWLAGRANGEFGRRGRWTNQRLWDWFGVGDSSDRGYTLRNAAGLGPEVVVAPRWSYGSLSLGDPALLHSRFRSSLLAQRDALLAIAARRRTWSLADDGRTARVRATPVTAVAAVKGVAEEGSRAFVVIGFGDELEDLDDLDDTTFFALTIPDAHELVRMVQRALADPLPRHEAS